MTCVLCVKEELSETERKAVAAALEILIQKHQADTFHVWNIGENHPLFEDIKQHYPHIRLDEKNVCNEADYVIVYGAITCHTHARVRYIRLDTSEQMQLFTLC